MQRKCKSLSYFNSLIKLFFVAHFHMFFLIFKCDILSSCFCQIHVKKKENLNIFILSNNEKCLFFYVLLTYYFNFN
jgi:hypothetical protein